MTGKVPTPNLDYLDNNIFTRFSDPKFMPKYMNASRYLKYGCAGLGFVICVHALLSPLPEESDQVDRDAELVATVTKQRFRDVREAMLLERAALEQTTGKEWGLDSQQGARG